MIGSIILAASLVSAETTTEPLAPSERLQNALTNLDAYAASAMPETGFQMPAEEPTRVHENVWTAAGKRLLTPVWIPYHAGVFYDLYSTDKVLALCATPEAVEQGWTCREGNPLSGGSTNAGRIAVSAGITYGTALMLTAVENDGGGKIPWWGELIFTSAVGVLRGVLVGYLNNMSAYDKIQESIR